MATEERPELTVLRKCFSGTLHLTLKTNLCRTHCYHCAFCITGETKARAFLKPVGGHPVGKRWRQDLNPGIWLQSKALNCVLLSIREWMKDCTKLNPSFLMRRLWRYSLFGVLESQVRNGHSADGPQGVLIEPRSRSESDTPNAGSLQSEGVRNQ